MRAAYPVDGAAGQPAKLDDLVMYSNGVTMPRDYTTIADRVYNFHCRPDDVWVVTYPKVRRRNEFNAPWPFLQSGTTWMLEMAWMVSHGVDLAAGRATPQTLRCPYIEGFKIGKLLRYHAREDAAQKRLYSALPDSNDMTGLARR